MALFEKILGSLERVEERAQIREEAREARHRETMAYLNGEISYREMRENKKDITRSKNEDIALSEIEGFFKNFLD